MYDIHICIASTLCSKVNGIWYSNMNNKQNNFEIISCNSKRYQHTSWINSQHTKGPYAYVDMYVWHVLVLCATI